MQSIPIHQAKTQLSELIRAAEQGEEVVLTRHGKPVVRLVAERGEQPGAAERERLAAQALEDLRAFRGLWRQPEAGEPALDWKALRDEGRKV
jgi:prevent-host-death family protein